MQTSKADALTNQIVFPAYLALGKLKEESIRLEENYQVGEYELLGQTVHVVKIAPGEVHFYDFFQGKKGAETVNQDLKKAVLQHFMLCKPSTQPALLFFYEQVCRLGNIYFQYLEEDMSKLTMTFYPAARLFILRLPVTDQNMLQAKELLSDDYMGKRFHDFYETTLTIIQKEGTKKVENIWLMEFIVPMAFVYDAAKVMVQKKVILSDKVFRLIIQDSVEKVSPAIHAFYGSEEDDWQTYMLKYEALKRP